MMKMNFTILGEAMFEKKL